MFDIVYDDEYVTLGIEWRQNEPIFHHDVKKWNATANRVMMKEMDKLTKLLKDQGFLNMWSYYLLPAENEAYLQKFAKKYDFNFVDKIENCCLYLKEL